MKRMNMAAVGFAVALSTIAVGCKTDDAEARALRQKLNETDTITLSNGAEVPLVWNEEKETKETPPFMLLKDAHGREVVYLVDMSYFNKKYGTEGDPEASAKYYADSERRAKKVFGFSVLQDCYFGNDDDLLPEYKQLIDKCRESAEKATAAYPHAAATGLNELIARKCADGILLKQRDKVPQMLKSGITVNIKKKDSPVKENYEPPVAVK